VLVPRSSITGRGEPGAAVPRAPGGKFQKGHSANPGGRPKGLRRIFDEVVGEQGVKKALEALASIAYGPLSSAAAMHVRVRAIELLLDRRYGKPHQTLDVGTAEGQSSGALATLTAAELEARRAALQRMLAPAAEEPVDAEVVG
jgi:hypothetical protein